LNLIYYEACLSQDDATKREKYLKSYHGRMFLNNRLKSYLTGFTQLNSFKEQRKARKGKKKRGNDRDIGF